MNWPINQVEISQASPSQVAEALRRYNEFRDGNIEWRDVGLSAHQVGDLLKRTIQLLNEGFTK